MRQGSHLKLGRPQVGETSTQQVTDKLMHKDSIVGVGCGSLGCLIPKGCLDDSAVHYAEQVVQDSGMELEPWLVEAVCSRRVTVKQAV